MTFSLYTNGFQIFLRLLLIATVNSQVFEPWYNPWAVVKYAQSTLGSQAHVIDSYKVNETLHYVLTGVTNSSQLGLYQYREDDGPNVS